jgi:hypothetical protein
MVTLLTGRNNSRTSRTGSGYRRREVKEQFTYIRKI